MRLTDVDLLRFVPAFMREDEAVCALARVVSSMIAECGAAVPQLRVWDRLEALSDAELDELAWELNVDWYDSTADVETKREVLRISDRIHRKRGTKAAVEALIGACLGPGFVQEWFEYDGPPFEFKVLTTNRVVTDEMMRQFRRIVAATKNARSRLEGIYFVGDWRGAVRTRADVAGVLFEPPRCGTLPKRAQVGRVVRQEMTIMSDYQALGMSPALCGCGKTGEDGYVVLA